MDPVTLGLVITVIVSGIVNILQAIKHTFKQCSTICGKIEFKETPPTSARGYECNHVSTST